MIEFKNLCNETPYITFKEKYDEAMNLGQKNTEAIVVTSYNPEKGEVDARFVNLKFIDFKKFVFFTNYNSPKSLAFYSNNQISAVLYWPTTKTQIRMKARIFRTSNSLNQEYFKKRSSDKNALAISSDQSKIVNSYNEILKKYKEAKDGMDLKICPKHWGGFYFIPYYFEFWKGHDSRINNRVAFTNIDNDWSEHILQP